MKGGSIYIGDVAFETREELNLCRFAANGKIDRKLTQIKTNFHVVSLWIYDNMENLLLSDNICVCYLEDGLFESMKSDINFFKESISSC